MNLSIDITEELYLSIPHWNDFNERFYRLDDYLIYRNKLEGRLDEIDNLKKDDIKMRTPDR